MIKLKRISKAKGIKKGEKHYGHVQKIKYKSFEDLRPTLKKIIEENNGDLPSKDLMDDKAQVNELYKGVNYAIQRLFGGFSAVRKEMELKTIKEKRESTHYTDKRLEEALLKLIHKYKRFPMCSELKLVPGLMSAVSIAGGIHYLAKKMNVSTMFKCKGFYKSKINCKAEIKKIAIFLKKKPCDVILKDLRRLERFDLISGIYIYQHSGVNEFVDKSFGK